MQNLLKYALILAIGATLGFQLSKTETPLSKIAMMKSKTDEALEKIIGNEAAKVHELKAERSEKLSRLISMNEASSAGPLVDLASVSLHELSLAVSKKRAEFARTILKGESPEKVDKKTENELFHQNLKAVEQSSRWLGNAELNLDGNTIPVTLVMNYYNPKVSTDFSKDDIDLNSVSESNTLCWFTTVYLDYKDKKLVSSTSNCSLPYVKDEKYFMNIDFMEASTLNDSLYYLLIPFPGSNISMEYLEAGQSEWKKTSEVSWIPFSLEDYVKFYEDHKEYKWAREVSE